MKFQIEIGWLPATDWFRKADQQNIITTNWTGRWYEMCWEASVELLVQHMSEILPRRQ